MCNLYKMRATLDELKALFGVGRNAAGNLQPLDEIYPGQDAPAIVRDREGTRALGMMRWGIPPPVPLAEAGEPGKPAEAGKPTAAAEAGKRRKPEGSGGPKRRAGRPVTNVRNLDSAFWRPALARPERRCLVPATAFAEWTGEAGAKRKVWFSLKDRPVFAFAGLWRRVEDEPARFAFLTCAPNETVGAVHPQAMPVLLTAKDAGLWLDGAWAEARADAVVCG